MPVRVEVRGEYALFTDPAFKVERTSYQVMTPSAARGILESVMWHPGMIWRVSRIYVCSPIRFANIRRNEVKSTVNARSAKVVMERGGGGLYIATSEDIQQRASMVLRDVHCVIDARFEMTEKANETDNPGKFQDMIKRRLKKGQCYSQPYLGCREFPAEVSLCEELPPCPEELRGKRDLGIMLWDMDYSDPKDIRPLFFHAVLQDGVLHVPQRDSGEVIG